MIFTNFKKFSVAQQFLISSLSAILLIVILFSVYMITTSIDARNAQFQIMTSGRSSGVIEKIDRNFYERFGDVQAFAVNKLAVEAASAKSSSEELQTFMNTMTSYYVLYDLMVLCDLEGKVIAANSTDKNGNIIKTNYLLGTDFSNEEWFRLCVSAKGPEGGAWFSDFMLHKEVSKIYSREGYGMAFAAPVKDKEGKPIGAWYNFANWEDVTGGIRRETENVLKSSNPGAFILITNSTDQVIDSNDPKLILTQRVSLDQIENGSSFTFLGKEIVDNNYVVGGKKGTGAYSYKGKDWNAVTFIPKTKFTFSYVLQNLLVLLLTVVILIFAISLVLYRLANKVSKNIKELQLNLEVLATGELLEIKDSKLENELGLMTNALKTLVNGLKNTANFAKQIGKGELLAEFTALGKNDEIGNSLLTMRQNLTQIKEADTQREWATSGNSKMGDILRSHFAQASQLYDEVLKFVVKYSNSSQGGIFLINEGEPNQLSMVACYAYDRKKFIERTVKIGESLVGQCFLERQTIYMTSLPKNYTNITTGLGDSTPACLILLPLKVNEIIVGVLELASLNPYQNHEKALLEKFAESIASTVSTVRINERTKQLLEQSQQQAEEMRAQEEEMRQNMEELTATQEEMARKEKEYLSRIETLEKQLEECLVN